MNLLNLANLIDDGIDISKKKENRSYLFSTFKRTVNGWKSDFTKIKDKTKDSEKIKKLTAKMHKEAEKYLDEIKNYTDEKNKTIVRNPKTFKEIEKLKKQLNTIKPKLDTLFANAKKAKEDIVEKAINYYKNNNLGKEFSEKQIDGVLNIISDRSTENTDNNTLLTSINNLTVNGNSPNTEVNYHLAKALNDDDFKPVVYCYIRIKSEHKNCENFTKWLKDEWHYLKNFDSISAINLYAYQQHYAFIDYSRTCEQSKQDATTLSNYISEIPDDIKNKFAQKASIFKTFSITATLASSVALLSLAFPPLAVAAATLAVGLFVSASIAGISTLIAYRKPLKKEVENSIKHAEEKLEKLKKLRKGTEELNQDKIKYMQNVVNNT